MEDYNTKLAIEAQAKYCKDHDAPNFAPAFDGSCFRCHQNIYAKIVHPSGYVTGITVEQAGRTLITGCPHCHYSFVD